MTDGTPSPAGATQGAAASAPPPPPGPPRRNRLVLWLALGAAALLALVFAVPTIIAAVNAPPTTIESLPPMTTAPTGGEMRGKVALETVQAWAAKHYESYPTFQESGTGDAEIVLPPGVTSGVITATHDGAELFTLRIIDSTHGREVEKPMSERGVFEEATAWGLTVVNRAEAPVVRVQADGAWTLEFSSFDRAPEFTGSGHGGGAFLYTGGTEGYRAAHDGDSDFMVWAEAEGTAGISLLINGFGSWQGFVSLPRGPALVVVVADGDWSFTP